MRCLDCGMLLRTNTHRNHVDCDCGLSYHIELLVTVDPNLWERIRTERRFVRVGNSIIGDSIIITEEDVDAARR